MHNLQYLQTSISVISVRNRRMPPKPPKPPKPFPTLGCVNTFRTTHWPCGELLMGKTEDPKNSPVVSPCLTMCGILLHAAARKCGTPVIITSPCQQPSSPAHRVGSWCAGRSFGFDHLQCQLNQSCVADLFPLNFQQRKSQESYVVCKTCQTLPGHHHLHDSSWNLATGDTLYTDFHHKAVKMKTLKTHQKTKRKETYSLQMLPTPKKHIQSLFTLFLSILRSPVLWNT